MMVMDTDRVSSDNSHFQPPSSLLSASAIQAVQVRTVFLASLAVSDGHETQLWSLRHKEKSLNATFSTSSFFPAYIWT